jgi:hypothetical protein
MTPVYRFRSVHVKFPPVSFQLYFTANIPGTGVSRPDQKAIPARLPIILRCIIALSRIIVQWDDDQDDLLSEP